MAKRKDGSAVAQPDPAGQRFRSVSLKAVTSAIGVYALCDLDQTPVYVGKSVAGIGPRVRRHLTSARSDVIANRFIDVWEIAWVWAWPTESREHALYLEAHLFHEFDGRSRLMNGSIPRVVAGVPPRVPERQVVQIMPEHLIAERRKPLMRLPRQIAHYQQLVDYLLSVKDEAHVRRSLATHFARLSRYHTDFLALQGSEPVAEDADEDE